MINAPKKTRKLTDKQRTAQQAANARASALFGDAPVFDSPRVQPEALRRAVFGMITRTWNNLPHVAALAPTDVAIQYVGRIAFTRHTWQTTARGKLHVSGSVNLPALPATGTLSRQAATDYLGYIVHEIGGHWLYTCPRAWRNATARYAGAEFARALPRISPAYARNVLNALEDVRIERELIASGIVRGAGACLRATLSTILAEARPEVDACNVRDFPFMLAYAMREHAAATDLLDGMPDALRAVYDLAAAGMEALRGGDVANGTAYTSAVAIRVLEALHPLLPERQEGTDTDGGDQPCDGEPGDGEQPGGDQPGEQPGDGDADGDDGGGEQPGDGDADGDDGDADKPTEPRPPQPGGNNKQPGTTTDGEPPAIHGDAKEAGRDSNITLRGDCDDLSGSVRPPVIKTDKITDDMRGNIAAVSKEVAAAGRAPVLRNQLRRLLECTANDSLEGGKRSGRINASALHRVASGADTVFRRRTMRDGVRAAVAICIDGSGSMQCSMRQAVPAALVLAEICTSAGARVDVSAFHDAASFGEDLGYQGSYGGIDDEEQAARDAMNASAPSDDAGIEERRQHISAQQALSGRRCKLTTVKAFNEPLASGYARAGTVYAYGGTPDMAALTSVCERVLSEDAGRRLVIFVTDGCGDPQALMAQTIAKYKARGVIVIAIGIGCLPACDAYPYRAEVRDARALGGASMRELLKALLAAPETLSVGVGD